MIRFRISKNNSLEVTIHENGEYSRKRLPFKANKDIWNQKKQAVIGNTDEANQLRSVIENIKRRLETEIPSEFFAKHGYFPGPAERMHELTQAQKEKSGEWLHHYFDSYIKGNQFSPQTNWRYNKCLKLMEEWAKKDHLPLKVNLITKEFIDSFVVFLAEKYENETIMDFIKKLSRIDRYYKLGLPINTIQISAKLKQPDKTMRPYVNKVELKQLMDKKLSGDQEKAIDCFVFCCFIGCRHQDLYFITPDNIVNKMSDNGSYKVVQYYNMKAFKWVEVPINPAAQAILDKWADREFYSVVPTNLLEYFVGGNIASRDKHDCALPVLPNHKCNQLIREVMNDIGGSFHGSFQRVRYAGTKRKQEYMKRYEAISFHSSRHTCGSLMKEAGLEDEQVASILGHDVATFKKWYKHETPVQVGNQLLNIAI